MKKMVLKWESIGMIIIVLVGATLHFLFEWTGYWRPIAWLAAVNESTWEHFKLAFWPALGFALVEYGAIRRSLNNFWLGKCLGLLSMPIVIAALFYGYVAILGEHSLMLDILIFILSVVVGQLISYWVLTAPKMSAIAQRCGAVVLAGMVVAFPLLSYFPSQSFLFEDPETGRYGILEEYGR